MQTTTKRISFFALIVATCLLLIVTAVDNNSALPIATKSSSSSPSNDDGGATQTTAAATREDLSADLTAKQLLELHLERMLENVLKEMTTTNELPSVGSIVDGVELSAEQRGDFSPPSPSVGTKTNNKLCATQTSGGGKSIRRASKNRHERRSPSSSSSRSSLSSQATDQKRNHLAMGAVPPPIVMSGGGPISSPVSLLASDQALDAIESLNSLLLGDAGLSRLERAYKPRTISTARGFGKRSVPILGQAELD